MDLDNQQVVCKLLKDEWSALKSLIESSFMVLRKIYDKIKTLTSRFKNTILRRIVATIYELQKIVEGAFSLGTLSNNMARTKWCQVMYKCKPMIKKLSKLLGDKFFTWLYGPDTFKTYDLSYFNIPSQTFTSKYEVYEYMACRLSLRGLLNNAAKDLIDKIKSFLNDYLDYLSLEYWLKRTTLGRKIEALLTMYENVFKDVVKPFLDELGKYLDCAFSICDFVASTKNFLADIKKRHSIECSEEVSVTGTITRNFFILQEDLMRDVVVSLNGAKAAIDAHNKKGDRLLRTTFGDKAIDNIQTTAETSADAIARNYDRNIRTNQDTPSLASSYNSKTKRETVTIYSPNSELV